MPRYHYSASTSRRVPKIDSDSESDDGYDYGTMESNAQKQAEIMMKDLGSDTRNFITTNERGGRPVNVPTSALQRECNKKGSKAARLASQNQSKLKAWSEYFSTSDAKAAGGEALDDLNGGNSHRLRVRTELRDNGISSLEDTYYNPRSRRGPPVNGRGRGAAAAIANDRGHYSHSRGGGFAGRGIGRGGMGRGGLGRGSAGVSRPLDPAVAPERVYSNKAKPLRKSATEISMNLGKVTVKSTGNSTTSNKAGRSTSPRVPRGSLPANASYDRQIEATDSFMAATLALFKSQAESGNHIHPAKSAKTEESESSALLQPQSTIQLLEQAASPDIAQSEDVKTSPEVHHIERDELGLIGKSPDAFTDGQPSQSNLSGFSPSIDSQADAPVGSTSQAGLGIQGVLVFDDHQSTKSGAHDLMDAEVPSDKNAALAPSLSTSRPDHGFPSDKEYAEYLEYKEFIASLKSRDFEQWQAQQKLKQAAAPSTSLPIQQASSVSLDISAGYKIGSGSLGGIIGDDRNVASQSKPTQTTPGLMQSIWASPELNTLITFKEMSRSTAQPQPSSLEPIPEVQEAPRMPTKTVETISSAVDPQGSLNAQHRVFNGLHGQLNDASAQQGNSRASEPKSANGIKPGNPFARREELDADFGQPHTARSQVHATKPQVAASVAAAGSDSVEANQPAQGVAQPDKASVVKSIRDSESSVAEPKDILNPQVTSKKVLETVQRNVAKETLSDSRWSAVTASEAPVAEEVSMQAPEPTKLTTAKRDLSGSRWAMTRAQDSGLVQETTGEDPEPIKPPARKQGLSASMWSKPTNAPSISQNPASGFAENQPAKSGLIFEDQKNVRRSGTTVLSPVSTNTLKKDLGDADPDRASNSLKNDLIKKSAPQAPIGAGVALLNPFQTCEDVSGRPAATIGDRKNARKSISKGTQDAASQSATAIERQFAGVLRSKSRRGQDRVSENVRQQDKPTYVKADREEGEIVEDNVDQLNGLTFDFGKMFLGRRGQK